MGKLSVPPISKEVLGQPKVHYYCSSQQLDLNPMNDPPLRIDEKILSLLSFQKRSVIAQMSWLFRFFLFELTHFLHFHLHTCAEVYYLLLSGDFSASGSDSAESYCQICQNFFPYASKFNLNSKDNSETPEDTIEDATITNSLSLLSFADVC